jgi:hypothetical protein
VPPNVVDQMPPIAQPPPGGLAVPTEVPLDTRRPPMPGAASVR